MSSRTARRAVLPGLAALGLVAGTPTVVWAHSPVTHTASAAVARPDRAELRVREASVGPDGRTRYTESRYVATAHTAEVQRTHSVTGGPGAPADAAGRTKRAGVGAPAADRASGTAGRNAPAATRSGPDGPRHLGRPSASAPGRTAHPPRPAQRPRARSHRFGAAPRELRMPAVLREPGMPREPRMPSVPRELADAPGPSF
mgnify:CR=1 FL=1